ncbi:MAG TPA: relaxase/mobilization nuclease domain-containing protein [Bacteroidia bacterium]|nr:relaxase/mobilization nuclease domain-containing protein [Bacteroidia bacterium]
MIIKIKSHKRQVFKQILEYMLNDKDRLFDENKNSFAITHNLKGKVVAEWEKQYKANELFRKCKRSDSVYLTHEILSWHRDDAKNITLAKMEEMAREYVRQRNPKGMYVAVPHFDKQHYHIHICASGIEYKTGKSLRLTKPELQNLKKNIQQFQIDRFPELSKSIVQHGKNEKTLLTDKEYQIKLRTGRETDKEQLIGMLKTCYKKADSKETFLQLLKESHLVPYERGGKTSGIVFNNKKFRLKRLGFAQERLEYLDRPLKRKSELEKVRDIKEKTIPLERNYFDISHERN